MHLSSKCHQPALEAMLTSEHTGTETHTGTQEHRNTGTQAHRHTGTQAHRHIGTSPFKVLRDGGLGSTSQYIDVFNSNFVQYSQLHCLCFRCPRLAMTVDPVQKWDVIVQFPVHDTVCVHMKSRGVFVRVIWRNGRGLKESRNAPTRCGRSHLNSLLFPSSPLY